MNKPDIKTNKVSDFTKRMIERLIMSELLTFPQEENKLQISVYW